MTMVADVGQESLQSETKPTFRAQVNLQQASLLSEVGMYFYLIIRMLKLPEYLCSYTRHMILFL